jgi:ketopantoate hydroxymethyltransferase
MIIRALARVAASNIDCILVGDSVAMVMHGHATTTAMIALHTALLAGLPRRQCDDGGCDG